MKRSIQFSEQRLLQTSIDLGNLLAEVQKLRAEIQLAEASKQYPTGPKVTNRVDRLSGSLPAFDR
jgi:hypothetical protein